MAGQLRQFVAAYVGNEIYGIDIACINSIILVQSITGVPHTPDYVLGVINLRGRIVPVIDLRIRFGLPGAGDEAGKLQRIVVVDVGDLTAGLVVDSVSEVMRLSMDDVQPPSPLLGSAQADCIIGLARPDDDRLVILLSVEHILSKHSNELHSLGSATAESLVAAA